MTGEINVAAQRNKYEPMVAARETTVVLRNGRQVQRWLFTMSDSVARMIRAHERADLAKDEAPVTSTE